MSNFTSDPGNFDLLKAYVMELMADHSFPLQVSEKSQQLELASLQRTIGSERFYFVVDMANFEIISMAGIEQWLGYFEKEFTLKKYWGLVHPGMQKLTHAVFLQMAEILCAGKFKLEFMVQRYSSLTAIRHRRGHYLLLKRTASVFQYDSASRLREYLNEFTVIGEYDGEALNPSFYNDKGQPEAEGRQIMEKVIESFLGLKVFSPAELQVARILVYQKGATQKDIARILGKSPHTIDTYCKRFLIKARDYFHFEFPSAVEAAIYLHKNGLI